jgi:hypothetical protein
VHIPNEIGPLQCRHGSVTSLTAARTVDLCDWDILRVVWRASFGRQIDSGYASKTGVTGGMSAQRERKLRRRPSGLRRCSGLRRWRPRGSSWELCHRAVSQRRTRFLFVGRQNTASRSARCKTGALYSGRLTGFALLTGSDDYFPKVLYRGWHKKFRENAVRTRHPVRNRPQRLRHPPSEAEGHT